MSDLLLSCLILTIPSRRETFLPRLLGELEQQGRDRPLEVLALYDNKRSSIGQKRNTLLQLAQGKYVTFFDDDDRLAPDYVDLVLDTIATHSDADCIVYDQVCTTDGQQSQWCKYGIELEYTSTPELWTGKPAHTMVWRTELVRSIEFADVNYGEDTDWVHCAWPKVREQVRINKALYFYDFNSQTTESRNTIARRAELMEPSRLSRTISSVQRSVLRPQVPVKCSVVIATYHKAALLDRTLESIFCQRPPFDYEVIVVDDGSPDDGQTQRVCAKYQSLGHLMRYYRVESSGYRNPGPARNYGYRRAAGQIIVAQSDDVVHTTGDVLEKLIDFEPGTFNIATVYNSSSPSGAPRDYYTGLENPRALFFLGSLLRADCYAIGGNCEDFNEPGYEDDWFGKCLIFGLGLRPTFRTDVVGWHQDHPRPNVSNHYSRMKAVFDRKYGDAAQGLAPWIGGPAWDDDKLPGLHLSCLASPTSRIYEIYQSLFAGQPQSTGAEFKYQCVLDFVAQHDREISTVLDLGSGQGTLLRELTHAYPEKTFLSADLAKFHSLDVRFQAVDLLSERSLSALMDRGFDLVVCLEVLDHLPLACLKDVLRLISGRTRYLVCSMANYSRIIQGIELHVTQRERGWWRTQLERYFQVIDDQPSAVAEESFLFSLRGLWPEQVAPGVDHMGREEALMGIT